MAIDSLPPTAISSNNGNFQGKQNFLYLAITITVTVYFCFHKVRKQVKHKLHSIYHT